MFIECAKFTKTLNNVPFGVDEDDLIFISDSTPQGFRWICEYIDANYEEIQSKKWYRLIIPFSASFSTPATYRLAGSTEPILGSVDASEYELDTYVIEQIAHPTRVTKEEVMKMEWPFPHTQSMLDLYGNAYCSQRHLLFPSVYTGCTEVQEFYLSQAKTVCQRELALIASCRFRLEYKVCLEQLKQISTRPNQLYHPLEPMTHFGSSLVPVWIAPDRISLMEWVDYFLNRPHEDYIPFEEWKTPREFFHTNRVITIHSWKEFIVLWLESKLNKIIQDEKKHMLEQERGNVVNEFIQAIYLNHFAKIDEASGGKKLKTFYDLSLEKKKQRIRDTFGPEWVTKLIDLPISRIDKHAFDQFTFDEEPFKKPRFMTATEKFHEDLQYYKKHSKENEHELDFTTSDNYDE